MPTLFSKDKNSGGKPVTCYDLDGFPLAYGLSQNCLENKKVENLEIADLENELHELSHDELLNKKDMQKKALNSIRRLEM